MKAQLQKPVSILLGDDDSDDRFFFFKALQELPFPTQFAIAEDGEKLMAYLKANSEKLPDVLFLDMNMPRKNGSECLAEIKGDPKLNRLPVIIYSTSLYKEVADLLYDNGAHYYVSKRSYSELVEILHQALTLLVDKEFARPERNGFILSAVQSPDSTNKYV